MTTVPGYDTVDYSSLTGSYAKLIILSAYDNSPNLASADYIKGEYQFTTTGVLTSLATDYTIGNVNPLGYDNFFRMIPGVEEDGSSPQPPIVLQGTTIQVGALEYSVLAHGNSGILVTDADGSGAYLLVITDDESVTLDPGTYNFSTDNSQVPYELPLRADTPRVEDSVASYANLVGTTLTGSRTNFTTEDGKTFDVNISRADIYTYVVQSVKDGVITVVDGNDRTLNLTVAGHDANGIFAVTTEGSVQRFVYITEGPSGLTNGQALGSLSLSGATPFDLPAVCFAEGVLIRTDRGEIAVEALREGDLVITASGETRAIKWVGSMLSRPARHRAPATLNPIRIRAGAFGEGLPVRDLRVSPGHAIFVDGVLIPAGLLVNGATIVQEEVDEIRYFHVELDSHDVLLAEGLPCESYLDDGNRASFANAGEFAVMNGRLDPKSWDDACAPMVAAGPQLAAVQNQLAARAEELGWVKSEDADLRLVVDGAEIAPIMARGNRFWFQAPAASSLCLVSNSGILAQVMPGLGLDHRRLGVAVSDLRIDGETVALDDAAFGSGFYPVEQHNETLAWRWTDGAAELVRSLAAPSMIEVSLVMVAPAWTRPVAALERIAA